MYISYFLVEVLKNGRKVSRLNRKTYELDSQSLVPLPARVCFTCRKSCKKAPLLACDYCNLLFHQVQFVVNFTIDIIFNNFFLGLFGSSTNSFASGSLDVSQPC